MGGSEGAQPPASSLRGRAKRGHGGYAGLTTLAASDKPFRRARERAGSTRRTGVLHGLTRPRPARIPGMDAARLVRSPDAGHGPPGGQASRDSTCTPRRNISRRAHAMPGPAIHPAEEFQRLLASPRVSDRQPASGIRAMKARKAVIGVASGPDPPHARRELARHDLHDMKANMESASRASAGEIGHFPPCAAAASCGIGVRPRAANRASMPAPRTAHPAVQDVQRPRHECRRGRRGRIPVGSVDPRAELVLRRLHASNAEEPLARQSTLGKRPNVSGRVRSFQNVSEPSVAVANGAEKRPRTVSAGHPRSSARRFVRQPERGRRGGAAQLTVPRARGGHAEPHDRGPHSEPALEV